MENLDRLVKAGERSPTYTRRLRDFSRSGGPFSLLYGRSIHSIDFGTLEDFAAELREGGLSPTSVFHVLSSLRTCLRWTAKRSAGTYAAPEFPQLRRGKYEPVTLTPEDQTKVLAAIAIRQRGAFLAMADLMIRPGEARAADVGDYDFRTRELRVEHAMKGETLDAPRRETKGRDERVLSVTSRLADWIEAHVGREDRLRRNVPLFSNSRAHKVSDRRWSGSTMRHVWESGCERAGLQRVGLYAGTKHSTATWLRQAGLSLDELGLAMGHAAARRTALTEGYARPPRVANTNIVNVLDRRQAQ
jgi:integrase